MVMTGAEMRKRLVFEAVVREHIRSAEPIGSETIVTEYGFGVSPATIRNDMADLEEMGLLEQPYTSAGRIPTEDGYRYFVEEFVGQAPLENDWRDPLLQAVERLRREAEAASAELIRTMAELTGGLAFLRSGRGTTLFSGIANLFSQPELRESGRYVEVSRALDDFDRLATRLCGEDDDGCEVLIGTENPLSPELSSVTLHCHRSGSAVSLFGIIGPKRMDYDTNVTLMRFLHEILEEARR